jgi:hypothetical protein
MSVVELELNKGDVPIFRRIIHSDLQMSTVGCIHSRIDPLMNLSA